jgi:hypothetical protein
MLTTLHSTPETIIVVLGVRPSNRDLAGRGSAFYHHPADSSLPYKTLIHCSVREQEYRAHFIVATALELLGWVNCRRIMKLIECGRIRRYISCCFRVLRHGLVHDTNLESLSPSFPHR